ncbi:MAG: hypothetical protein QOJ06_2340, partial [Pseudonocardiales bacterium]|nr:hypothetical protein [Pseudonocardiales bacterium]
KRSRGWRCDDRFPPRTAPRDQSRGLDDLANHKPTRVRHPQPQKRPKSSYLRFAAEQPNKRWQLDITHWTLSDGTDVEILNLLDDHSRLCVGSDTLRVFKAHDVDDSFRKAAASYGDPASMLSDIQTPE